MGVRVSPGARRTEVKGLYSERLKVAVAAPPESGRANEELTAKMAAWLDLPRRSVWVESGQASRDKVLGLQGLSEEAVAARLASLIRGDKGEAKGQANGP